MTNIEIHKVNLKNLQLTVAMQGQDIVASTFGTGPKALSDIRKYLKKSFAKQQPVLANKSKAKLIKELKQYSGGRRRSFSFSLKAKGTDFQRGVWRQLQKIPFGQVKSYQQIARALCRPKASRAVGNACGKNPLPIFIPCHRVVAANGLGGFGGGLALKKKLLSLESKFS